MALLLDKTSDNGVKTAYHHIAAFTPDFDRRTVQVVVRSYTADSYRETEKAQFDTDNQIETLRSQIEALLEAPTDENEQERIDLSNQLNQLTENQTTKNDYFVVEQKLDLPVAADFEYTRRALYELLKQGQFASATDC